MSLAPNRARSRRKNRSLAAPGSINDELPERLSLVAALPQKLDQLAFSSLLPGIADVGVAECFSDLNAVESICRRGKFDVALIDVSFPRGRSFEVGRILLRDGHCKRVAYYDSHFAVLRAAEALGLSIGAHYFTRNFNLGELSNCMRLKANIPDVFFSDLSHVESRDRRRLLTLSARELSVWRLIVLGHTEATIGQQLNLAQSTASNHRANLHAKLKVHKATELVHLAVQHGLRLDLRNSD